MTTNQCLRQILYILHDDIPQYCMPCTLGLAKQLYKYQDCDLCFLGNRVSVEHVCVVNSSDQVLVSIGHKDCTLDRLTYTATDLKSNKPVAYSKIRTVPIKNFVETNNLHNLFKKMSTVFAPLDEVNV